MKILVTGAVGSGKSSYIKFFDDKAMNIEAQGLERTRHTVGMDLATLKLDEFTIYLFGTPGLLRMQVMRDILADGADGVIFLLDAINSETDMDAFEILNSLKSHLPSEVPIIFCANKADDENARSPEEIASKNKEIETSQIIPTSTKTGLNLEKSLKMLVNQVYDNYEETFKILREFQNDLQGLAKRLGMDKDQLRDFLYTLELKKIIEIDRINRTIKVKDNLHKVI